MKNVIEQVTRRIAERSHETRSRYVARMKAQAENGKTRTHLSCGNLAHTVAACSSMQKEHHSGFHQGERRHHHCV